MLNLKVDMGDFGQFRLAKLADCPCAAVAVLVVLLGGCVNEQRFDLRPYTPSEAEISDAVQLGKSYIAVRNGKFQIISDISFDTLTLGQLVLKSRYVSDGSSSPLAEVEATRLAGFLHDALYRGSPYLEFPDGFPGRWTKAQTDKEYCHQLEKPGVSERQQLFNCAGPGLLLSFISPWDHHRAKRQEYWANQQLAQDQYVAAQEITIFEPGNQLEATVAKD